MVAWCSATRYSTCPHSSWCGTDILGALRSTLQGEDLNRNLDDALARQAEELPDDPTLAATHRHHRHRCHRRLLWPLLARAGFDVHFLLRSEYDAVRANGLQLNSAVHGALALKPVQAYRDVAEMPPCDWLLVGAKTTSNADLAPLIAWAAAPGAKVVLLQNGLAVEDALRPLLPDSLHLLGGLCYICVHRDAPG